MPMPLERIRTIRKACKPSGLGKGSHKPCQRLVEARIKNQTNVWVLYSQTCQPDKHPLPPPPCHARAGVWDNFFQVIPPKGFSMTIIQKEYTHGI